MDTNDLGELYALRGYIETPIFQKYLVDHMRDYQKNLKGAYDCKTLGELNTLKGKKEGSEEFFRALRIVHETITQLESLDKES